MAARRHRLIWEKNRPHSPEGLICRDEQDRRSYGALISSKSTLVSADPCTRKRGPRGSADDICRAWRSPIRGTRSRRCDLELLREIGGPGEQYAPAVFNQSEAERPPPDGIFPPARAGRNTEDWRPFRSRNLQRRAPSPFALEDHRHGVESNVSRVFPGGQPRFRKDLRSKRRLLRSTISCSAESGEEASGGAQPSLHFRRSARPMSPA